MAKRGGFDYSQFEQLYKNVETMRRDYDAWFEDYLLKEALIAWRMTKERTPVATGTLRGKWSISDIERDGDSLFVYLVNVMEYASYMEEGFYQKGGWVPGIWKSNGKFQYVAGAKTGMMVKEKWFEGFHMAELSVMQVMSKTPMKFQREFERFMRDHGWGG